MGILNNITQTGTPGLGSLFNTSTNAPKSYDADFKDGLKIVEVVDGKERSLDAIVLVGSFMPHVPFEFGGKQQIVKDYYPGNSEPVVQVLGPREDDVTIHGRLKNKRFKLSGPQKFQGASQASQEYQELIDAMRIRGNLVKITLGEWRRYGFIEACSFKMNRLCDIEYSITFAIVGFNLPRNCKNIDGANDDLIAPNKEITNAAASALSNATNIPSSMPRSLANFIQDQVGAVANVVSGVTRFVNGAVSDAQTLVASANRGVGLIRNARASISQMNRALGALSYNVNYLASGANVNGFKNAFQLNHASHLKSIMSDYSSLSVLLAGLQAQFEALSKTVPLSRHLVRQGDTLQNLAITYYNDATLWSKIYTHNQLTSTVLVVGSVLEIPKP